MEKKSTEKASELQREEQEEEIRTTEEKEKLTEEI